MQLRRAQGLPGSGERYIEPIFEMPFVVSFAGDFLYFSSHNSYACRRCQFDPLSPEVILKLSGESFVHAGERGIHMDEVVQIAKQAMRFRSWVCKWAL